MTDDEDELKLMAPFQQEVWNVKRDIRVAFKIQ
jgi:hypothetical protein